MIGARRFAQGTAAFASLAIADIWRRLDEEYDSDDFAWMRAFKAMRSKIPPRKTFRSIEQSRIDKHGQLPPAALSEPDRWKTFDLAVKLTRKQWYLDTGTRLPASDVRKLLKAGCQGRSKTGPLRRRESRPIQGWWKL